MTLGRQQCPQEGGNVSDMAELSPGRWHHPHGAQASAAVPTSLSLGFVAVCPHGVLAAVGLFEGTVRGMLWKCQVASGTLWDTEAGGVRAQLGAPGFGQAGHGDSAPLGTCEMGTAQVTLSPCGPRRARLHCSPGGLRPWHQCSPSMAPAQAACGDISAGVTGSGQGGVAQSREQQ